MTPIADRLPPEIVKQLHPDRLKNEAGYWVARDQLLEQYRGQWIGIADGRMIASDRSPAAVFHEAESSVHKRPKWRTGGLPAAQVIRMIYAPADVGRHPPHARRRVQRTSL
jgi:hypothetical protein